MNEQLKIFWMGFWRLVLGLVILVTVVYTTFFVVSFFGSETVLLVLLIFTFLGLSYMIGEAIRDNREYEERKRIALMHLDKERENEKNSGGKVD